MALGHSLLFAANSFLWSLECFLMPEDPFGAVVAVAGAGQTQADREFNFGNGIEEVRPLGAFSFLLVAKPGSV